MMTPDKHLLALYGLKYNPFLGPIPAEDLWVPPGVDVFCSRVCMLFRHGGFAFIGGEPGLGKSTITRFLAHYLDTQGEVVVGVMERPQSSLSDLYRELGELFGVNLSPSNRYGGFKALRGRWQEHTNSTLLKPVLLVDEAQEAPTACLNELRLLGSAHFDSQCLLTTVLCGDTRLSDRFRTRDLLSLGSRIRIRHVLEPYKHEDLLSFVNHIIEQAGAPHLLTEELKLALVEHAAGNLRVLTNMAAELLAAGAEKELENLDDKLFFEVFSNSLTPRRKKSASRSVR